MATHVSRTGTATEVGVSTAPRRADRASERSCAGSDSRLTPRSLLPTLAGGLVAAVRWRWTSWAIWAAGVAMVLVGVGHDNPYPMAWGTVVMASGTMARLVRGLAAAVLALPLMVAFVLFLLSRVFTSSVLNYPHDDPNRFGMPFNFVSVEVHIFGSLALALAGLHVAFLALRSIRDQPRPRRRLPLLRVLSRSKTSTWISRTESAASRTRMVALRRASMIGFLITLPLQLYVDVRNAIFVATHSYFEFYLTPPVALPGPGRVLAGAFAICYLSYLATLPPKRAIVLPTALYVAEGVVSLGSGQRQGFMLTLAIVAVYVAYRHFSSPAGERWVTVRAIRATLVALPLLAIVMVVIGRVRTTPSRQVSGVLAPFADFLYAQGVSINVIGYGYVYRAQIPGDHLYSFGPVLDLLTRRLPALVGKGPGVLSGQTVERATQSGWFSHLLSYLVDPAYYLRGGGMGSSFVAELWADFGYPGVFIGSLAVGLVVVGLTRGLQGGWLMRLACLALGREIILIPRDSTTKFIVEAVTAPAVLGLVLIVGLAAVLHLASRSSDPLSGTPSRSEVLQRGRSAASARVGRAVEPAGPAGAVNVAELPATLAVTAKADSAGPGPRARGAGAMRVNISWTLVGNLVFALSQWLMLAGIARELSATDVGAFSLAASIVAPVLVFTQLQLRIVLATDVRYRYRFADFLVLRGWTTLLMLATVLGVTQVTSYASTTDEVILLFAAAKAFDAGADILYGYHQRLEHMRAMAIGQIVNGVLSVIPFLWVIVATRSLRWAMVAYAAGSAAALFGWAAPVTIAVRRRTSQEPRDQPPRQVELLRKAAPLALVLLLAALSASIPRFFVESELGTRELGVFGAVSYLIIAGANVINSVGNAISPRLARYYVDGEAARFRTLVLASTGVGAALALLGALVSWIVGGRLLDLLYTAEYAGSGGLLTALSLAAVLGFAASFAVGAATAAQRFHSQLPVFVLVCLVGTVACAVLVPSHGLMGAAMATAAMGAVQLVGCGVIVWRAMGRMTVRG
jgi:oligosaccharide repeat unit polymerase